MDHLYLNFVKECFYKLIKYFNQNKIKSFKTHTLKDFEEGKLFRTTLRGLALFEGFSSKPLVRRGHLKA